MKISQSFSLCLAPPAPSGVASRRLNDTHINVSWQPIPLTESKGFIESYIISLSRATADSSQSNRRQVFSVTVPGNQTYVVIGGLTGSASYSVSVTAATMAGMGEESQDVFVREFVVPEEEGFFTMRNIIIIACAGGGLLILVGLAIVITIICVKKKNKK